ncbi:MAG: hypothetical protein NPIRA01_38880 [Nitrospirales bacterium]|nr:MAG: hypothetical protein NPIRA01_38880 [Nitrospirales bacterium]
MNVMNFSIHSFLEKILERVLPDHGFADHLHGKFRPDATAWAMMVLNKQGIESEIVRLAGDRLLNYQMPDGRVVISIDHPDVLWPTPLAVLAWQNSKIHHNSAWQRAVLFMLQATGVHWEKPDNDFIGHDTGILGWSWTDRTHSWVTPTALSMMALTVAGYGDHSRVTAGANLLLDRQISTGGWNYGNTSVLGKSLHPFPETTGMALNALAGRVPREAIEPSLQYLQGRISTLRTPLSLGWSVLGLKAWSVSPDQAQEWIVETLERDAQYGGYDTPSLCLLLAASLATEGLESLIVQEVEGATPS